MSKSFKRNYVDVYQVITPSYYKGLDSTVSGASVDIVDKILTADLKLIEENLRVICLSSAPFNTLLGYDGSYCSALPQYFVKQNNLTNVTTEEFELVIMNPLGYTMKDYTTSAQFEEFLLQTLLPNISVGADTAVNNVSLRSSGKYGETNEEAHRYLLESLGLFHILNYSRTSGTGVALSYQTPLARMYATKLFGGGTLVLSDAIKVLKAGIWSCSNQTVIDSVFINEFKQGSDTWTSGTQQRDKMDIWTEVIYNENYSEESDTYVRDVVEDFIDNGDYPETEIPNGPFYRFQRAVGFLTADINNQIVSLETLHSIENCPTELLPYLADIIGWEFYTSNTDAWRRQLRSAVSLYKQKGTPGGLENLIKTILPSFNIDFDSMYSEFYESYVPNLLYYLLRTESFLTSSTQSWTQVHADEFTNGEIDPINIDNSVRILVDHILLECVDRYPHLFSIRGYQFDLADPEFVFNYRGRDFSIPPWEKEKFYQECAVTEELLEFLYNKLICLGVTREYAQEFYDYVLENTNRARANETKYYGVGFLFFTSGLELPPNYSHILNNYDRDKFKLMPLWSGKSSHFDLSLSTADINDEFFAPGAFDREDFFASLEAIPRFIPAKAIPRSHVDLTNGDPYVSFVSLSPRATTSFMSNYSVSGALGGTTDRGLNMRTDKAALLGKHLYGGVYPGEDLSKTAHNHKNRPVFKRSRMKFGKLPWQTNTNDDLSGSPLTMSGDEIGFYPRGATRRRNDAKTLFKGDWFTRTGFNDPTRLNKGRSTSYGLGTSGYIPLGFSLSGYRFTPITEYFDLPGVWEGCEIIDVTNSGIWNGVQTSATFPLRGYFEIPEEMNPFNNQGHLYKFRDDIEDVPKLMYDLIHLKIHRMTETFLDRNSHMFAFNQWRDFYDKVYTILWNNYEYKQEDLYDIVLSKYRRRSGRNSLRDLFYLYENFFAEEDFDYFVRNDQRSRYDQNTAYSLLEDYIDGGDNILSRIYGPFVYNGLLTVDGSAIGNNDVNQKNTSIEDNNEFLISLADKNAVEYNQVTDMYLEKAEFRTPNFFSGVDLCYRPNTQDTMFVFSLSDNGSILEPDAALLDNNMLGLRVRGDGTRLRYEFDYSRDGGGYGPSGIFLDPEHYFSITTRSIFLDDESFKSGGRQYAVWIHTEPEYDYKGDLIYWNYSKDGKWEMRDAAEVTSKGGFNLVVDQLSHLITHEDRSLESQEIACYSQEDLYSRAWSVKKSDLVEDTIKFNTLNQPIKVPLDYFRINNQVHRPNQKYVIEIFPLKSLQKSLFWLFDGISVVDETVKEQSLVPVTYSIDDYRIEQLNLPDSDHTVRFFDTSGQLIPLGTVMDVDIEGNITLSGQKITTALALSQTTYAPLPRPVLYTKPNVIKKQQFFDNGTTEPEQKYGGKFYQTDYTVTGIYPTIVRVLPGVRGSYIPYNKEEYILMEPRTLLEVMSFFKAKSKSTLNRRLNKLPFNEYKEANPMGFYGGSRNNYRDIVNGEWTDIAGQDVYQFYKNITTKN